MTEKEVIEGCKRNDRRCQRVFVDTFSPYLAGVCRRYHHENVHVQDSLQEALVKILTHLHQYEEQGSFKSWAARVTATTCLQNIRKEKRHINFDIENSEEPSIDEEVSYKMEMEDVLSFLDTLPTKYRIAINMYVIDGYSHKEIAERLEITESSSRSLVTRGRKMIREAFAEESMKVVFVKKTEVNNNQKDDFTPKYKKK